MYLLQRLRQIYETHSADRTEYLLCQYVLCHLGQLDTLSVSSIATATSISKSAVSKFFKSLTNHQNFDAFRSALHMECQYSLLDSYTLVDAGQTFINEMKDRMTVDLEGMSELAGMIKKSSRVLLYGNPDFHDCFNSFINALLVNGKDIRYALWSDVETQNRELKQLTSDDLFILIEPDNTLFEFILRANMSVDVFWEFNRLKAQKVYFGKDRHHHSGFFNIALTESKNAYMQSLYLQLYAAHLLIEYLPVSISETKSPKV